MGVETKEQLVYACGHCGKLFRAKKDADFCHTDRTCNTCGAVIGKLDYYTSCQNCRTEKQRKADEEAFKKATKMTVDEYVKAFPQNPIVYNDAWFFNVEDIYEQFYDSEDETPEYVWGTECKFQTIDYSDVVQDFEEHVEIEDYELDDVAVKELKEFFEQWNKKYGQDVYYESNKIAVLL
jgi:DNA-directed RNA polymerase subunit RPC12/RpoP